MRQPMRIRPLVLRRISAGASRFDLLVDFSPEPSSDALLPWVETDEGGRFTIDSVAPDQLAGLLAITLAALPEGPGHRP